MASSASSKSKSVATLVPRGDQQDRPAIALSRPVWVIGARSGCHLQLNSSTISQIHCAIINTGHGFYVRDLGSRTHTYVNRQEVTEAVLHDGDKLQIGRFKFYFKDPSAKPNDTIPDAAPSILQITGETMQLALSSRVTTIGRKNTCDITLDYEDVSTTHALILDIAGKHYLRDMGSRTGTFLNGQKIHQEALKFGDLIRVGETELSYFAAPQEGTAEAASSADSAIAMPALDDDEELGEAPEGMVADLPDADELASLAPDEVSDEVSATATPVGEDDAPVQSITEPAPLEIEPLSLDLDLLDEPAAPAKPAPVVKSPAPKTPSAKAPTPKPTPKPPTVVPPPPAAPPADAVDLSIDQPLELDHNDHEDTAFAIQSPIAPKAPEPEPERPVEIRRGWRSSLDVKPPIAPPPPAKVELPNDEITIDEPEAVAEVSSLDDLDLSSLSVEPEAESEPLALEPLAALPKESPAAEAQSADDAALESLNVPAEEEAAEPQPVATSEQDADDLAMAALEAPDEVEAVPAEEVAAEEVTPEASAELDEPSIDDLALAALEEPTAKEAQADIEPLALDEDITPAPAASAAPIVAPLSLDEPIELEAKQDEVTAGELELSDPSTHDDEVTAEHEDVFSGVDLEALALEVLSEDDKPADHASEVSATSNVTVAEPEESPAEEEAGLDLSISAEEPAEPVAASAPAAEDDSLESSIDLSISDEPENTAPTASPEAASAADPDASSLDLSLTAEEPSTEAAATEAVEEDTLHLEELLPPEEPEPVAKLALQDPEPLPPVSDEIPSLELDVLDPVGPSESVFDTTVEPAEISATGDVADLEPAVTLSDSGSSVEAPALETPAEEIASEIAADAGMPTLELPAAEPLPLESRTAADIEPAAQPPVAEMREPAVQADLSPTKRGARKAPPKSRDKTPNVPSSEDINVLPPALETDVRVKPSTRRRGGGGKRGRKGAAPVPQIELPEEIASTSSQNEVIEPTEPTPESALNLESEPSPTGESSDAQSADMGLSDSVFGKAVEELAGSALGELVEPQARNKSPLEQIVSEASSFVPHSGQAPKSAEPIEPTDEEGPDLASLAAQEAAGEAPSADEPLPDLEELLGTPTSEAEFIDEPLIAEIEESAEVEQPTELDEPVTSIAGTIHPGPISAVATETAPEFDDLESLAAASDGANEPAVDNSVDTADDDAATVDDLAAVDELPSDDDEPAAEAEVSADDTEPLGEAAIDAVLEHAVIDGAPPIEPESIATPPHFDPLPVEPPHMPMSFFGISRDADAFIGGMPLVLPELAPPPSSFGKVSVAFTPGATGESHLAPPPPPLMIGEDDSDEIAELPPEAEDEAPLLPPPVIDTPNDLSMDSLVRPNNGPNNGPNAPRPPESNIHTPPRPRRARLADYEKRFADVADDAAIREMMFQSKPSNKAPSDKPSPSGFDGLAIAAPVREADVFSQMPASADVAFISEANKPLDPFLVDKQASIDLAARNIQPGSIPPGSEPNYPVDPAFGDVPIAARAAASDPLGLAGKMRRSSIPAGPSPSFEYTGPVYKKRKIGLPVMLGAMVVFMVIAGVLGFVLTPVSSTLHAKATFSNLSQRQLFDQLKFHREEEGVVNSEVVRSQAVAILKQKDSQVDAGVLADPFAYEKMTRELSWPEKTNYLLFELQSVDPRGDQKRLAALLMAIYNENKNLVDQAGQNQQQFADAQKAVDALNGQLNALVAKIRILNNADDRPSGSQIADVERQATQLSDVWGQAVAKVKDLQATLDRLQPSELDPAIITQPGADPDKDAVILQWRDEVAGLQSKIDAAKPLTLDVSETARKTLDDALQQFQDQLTIAQQKMSGSAEMTAYVNAAQKLQALAKQLTSELIERQRVQNDRLADLKRRLDEQSKTHKDEVYENDAELKSLNDKRAFARRSYNSSSAEGMEAEAARWQQEVAADTAAIDARKAQLGQDPAYAKLNGEIQSIIDGNAKALATDQQLLQGQMDDVATALRAASPGIAKLPPDQKAIADALAKRTSELFEARQAYVSIMNSAKPVENDDLKKMQSDAKVLALKIDQRTAELKDAAKEKQNQSDMEKATIARKMDDTKQALAQAKLAEGTAQTQWLAKQAELNTLRDKLNQARKDDATLEDAIKQRRDLEGRIGQAVKDLDGKRSLAVSVVPEMPTADAVTVGEYHDPRWKYASICIMAVVGLFSALILLGGFHQTAGPVVHRPVVESVDPVTKDAEDDSNDTVAV